MTTAADITPAMRTLLTGLQWCEHERKGIEIASLPRGRCKLVCNGHTFNVATARKLADAGLIQVRDGYWLIHDRVFLTEKGRNA